MKNSINVYWGVAYMEGYHPSLPLLIEPPLPVISDYAKFSPHKEYIKCPAFHREFQNTFVYKSPSNSILDIDPNTMEAGSLNSLTFLLRDSNHKQVSVPTYLIFFSDQYLEMSLIPSMLHNNNFINNTKLFSGKYNIGKWFRPLNMDFILKIPQINIKKGDALFYLKFDTDKKINFINFEMNENIAKIQNSCLSLKTYQSNLRFKNIYNYFLRIGYHKRLLKEIKKNITPLK